jgi:hypothetical protein
MFLLAPFFEWGLFLQIGAIENNHLQDEPESEQNKTRPKITQDKGLQTRINTALSAIGRLWDGTEFPHTPLYILLFYSHVFFLNRK